MIVNSSSKTPIESAEFSAISKPKSSYKSKSKASSVSSMRGWLTKLKLPSGTKKFINLKICNNKREKVDNPMFLNKKYLLPSCLVKEREIQKNYTALKNGLDKLIHSILSKCDNERQNSAKSMCISNQCDLYVEDLRKEKFNECLELIQMLDDSICFNTKAFNYLKNFLMEERHQAEGIRKEFRSGMMDPTREAARAEKSLTFRKFDVKEANK